VSAQTISVSLAWAISQYRETVATLAGRIQGVARALRPPQEPPEVTSYWRAIGVGRNIDAYA
jgi:hypothetical protein